MEPDKSEHLGTLRFDEELETWFLHTGSGRIPLSRVLLQHLVSLYNDIHRGSALTLVDRRALEELDRERRDLARDLPSLRDQIESEGPGRDGAGARFWRAFGRGTGFILHLAWPRSRRAARPR